MKYILKNFSIFQKNKNKLPTDLIEEVTAAKAADEPKTAYKYYSRGHE